MRNAGRDTPDDLTPNRIKAVLQYTALAIPGDAAAGGAGALNAAGALELASSLGSTHAREEWRARLVAPPFTAIGGQHYAWGQTVIWGTMVISGTSVYVDQPAWAPAAVWGQTVIWGTAVQ